MGLCDRRTRLNGAVRSRYGLRVHKMHLIIGGKGLVGSALRRELDRRGLPYSSTTRRTGSPSMLRLDLADLPPYQQLPPPAEYVWLVAAIPTFQEAEQNPLAWRVNVDAPIELARHYRLFNSTIVFISSNAVEWAGGNGLRAAEGGCGSLHAVDRCRHHQAGAHRRQGGRVCSVLARRSAQATGGGGQVAV